MPRQRLLLALNRLIENDHQLLSYQVNERSMTHKLAEHLQALFPDWNVDCEYNRKRHEDTKTLDLRVENTNTDDTEAKTVYPDIIVHRRGSRGRDANLLVLEIKKSNNLTGRDHDMQKLLAFVKQLDYQNAALVTICVRNDPGFEVTWVHPR